MCRVRHAGPVDQSRLCVKAEAVCLGGRNMERDPSGDGSISISLSELARGMRLSRATLRYYEKIGILVPEDGPEDGGTRHYSLKNGSRLVQTITLRNLGLSLDEAKARLDAGDAMSPEAIDEYRGMLRRRMDLLEAQDACLALHRELVERLGEIWVERLDAYLFDPTLPLDDASETERSENDAMCLPVSSYGILFKGASPCRPDGLVGGRAVRREHSACVEGFPDDATVIGDCLCLRTSVLLPTGFSFKAWTESGVFDRLAEHADSHRLSLSGPAFVAYGVPSRDGTYLALCLPVRESRPRAFARGVRERTSRDKK